MDKYLVENSLAPSRTKAQEMIQNGKVEVFLNTQFQVMNKPGFKVGEATQGVRLVATDLLKYVARSGLKLEYAIKELGVSPKFKRVLDIGLSTGGFAHCLLEYGASQVVGVDVGRGQLHPRLWGHPRLVSFEGVNARHLRTQLDPPYGFDLITIDVSFISLKHIVPEVPHFLAPHGEFLFLVKPQFEQSRVYRRATLSETYKEIQSRLIDLCQSLHLNVESYIESRLPGRNHEKEFFIYGKVS